MLITSIHNHKILSLRKLYKNSERKSSDIFISEGRKEVFTGLKSNFNAQSVFICPKIFNDNEAKEVLNLITPKTDIYEIDSPVYEKIAYRDKTEGIIAVFQKKLFNLEDIVPTGKSKYIVLESVEKPGNLGAVLRTADAFGVSALILTESKVDQYNPNVIRASLGAVFNIPVIESTNKDLKKWLKKYGVKSFSASLQAKESIYTADLTNNCAFIFGSESHGLTEFWRKNSDKNFIIPMFGSVDSLNVSVSVGIIIYEALRQENS